MSVTLVQMKAVEALSCTGKFSAAAEALGISHYLVCLPDCRDRAAVSAFFDMTRAHHGEVSGATPGIDQ